MDNKEQLTIKHLAPYLPYRLNCYASGEYVEGTEYNDNPTPKLLTIAGMDISWITVEGIRNTADESIMIEDCFPILRQLSDLTKEIEVNGEKFLPKNILFKGDKSWITLKRTVSKNAIHNEPYWLIEKLLSWHFDVFGLIEKGLAIDLNTIQK